MPKSKQRGSVRVGTLKIEGQKRIIPSYPNHTPIVVHTEKSGKYSSLSPYVLKNDKGEIMENIWHSRKVWAKVPKTNIPKSRWDKTVIWEHPAEDFLDEKGEPNKKYWQWRKKLLASPYAVRYPAGFANRKNTLYSLEKEGGEKLSYIQARKKIYLPVYTELAKKQKEFTELKERLDAGENLMIIEVDGPKQESLQYYRGNYKNIPEDWIERDSIQATKENMEIMLNDEKHPFGHGYCLAAALQDISFDH